MGTPLGPKYIPYTYMDPLGMIGPQLKCQGGARGCREYPFGLAEGA